MTEPNSGSQPADVDEYDHFIDGEFVASTADDRFDVVYPYDGSVWATVPLGTSADIDRAVETARKAFDSDAWGELRPAERAALLHAIADTLDAHVDELATLETRQNGKLIREMSAQMAALGEYFRYYASLCRTREGRTIPVENKDGNFFTYVKKEPYGVVAAVTPWNSPLLLTAFKLAPALAAGCTFVHKPSSHTAVSALRFAELLSDAGLPAGVYNVVTGSGGTAGDALVNHDDVDKVAFTGSTAVGRQIGASAGEKLVPVSLELGGKSPNIVFPSANLENAINGIVKGIFAATGQTCLAGSRVFVHEEIAEAIVDRLVDRASSIRLGDPMDPETEMGPVAFRGQLETIRSYIETAREEGATISHGGTQPDNLPGECFFEPTIVTDVDDADTVVREEIFGPVASVLTFTDEDEVIGRANDSPYGLAAGVWTEDMRQAQRVADRLEAGTVWVNEYRTLAYNAPFGGYKDSGLGRELGREGLEAYLQTKTVWIDQSGTVDDPFTLG